MLSSSEPNTQLASELYIIQAELVRYCKKTIMYYLVSLTKFSSNGTRYGKTCPITATNSPAAGFDEGRPGGAQSAPER